jgi:hypothetical protein
MRGVMKLVAASSVAVLLAVSSAAAQVQATAVMKSGERHTGLNAWVRADKGEFALRESQSQELRVPFSDVAYVDFGGTSNASPDISGSQWAVVMRNGNVVRGQLIEMGHTNLADTSSPYVVTFRDEQGQERRYSSNEVARVYFPGGTAAATGTSGNAATPAVPGAITVQANQPWTSTGISVRKGQRVTFTTTGQVQLSTAPDDIADANGSRQGRFAPNSPVRAASAGALVARVGNGAAFPIGASNAPVTMPANGVLYLGVNDDQFADNQGNFQVIVK